MSALERGFKAWSERTALAFRNELKVDIDAALSPTLLADYLGVQLWTPHQVPGMTSDLIDQLLENDPWGWSATSLQVDGSAIVIFNPRHSKGRQASDVAHELAHIILEHQPATLILSADLEEISMRSFNQKQEDEANCLGWTMLLPRDALMRAKRGRLSTEAIAEQFGVTNSLVSYRINATGVEKQLRAMRRR